MVAVPIMAKTTIDRILFATDFSKTSLKALQYAAAIARQRGARVFLFHALTTGMPTPEMAYVPQLENADLTATEQQMKELVSEFNLEGLKTEFLVRRGNPWPAMLTEINSHEIDLIVLGTEGRGGLSKLVLGSVAEEVCRLAACPVLTVNVRTPMLDGKEPFRKVLYTTDFSAGSARALRYASEVVSKIPGGQLTLLHVVDGKDAAADPGRVSELAIQRMRSMLAPEIAIPTTPKFLATFGSPAEVIMRVAGEQESDLIVMGVDVARNVGVATHFPWSVAHKVLCSATCPVLTVRG